MFIRPHLRNSLRIGFINWKLIIQLSYISNRLNCTGCSFLSFSFSRCRFSSSAILSGPSHLSAWRRSVLYSSRLSYPFSNSFFSRRLTADSRDCRRLPFYSLNPVFPYRKHAQSGFRSGYPPGPASDPCFLCVLHGRSGSQRKNTCRGIRRKTVP